MPPKNISMPRPPRLVHVETARQLLVGGFWFLPGLLIVAALGLAFLTLWVDRGPVMSWLVGTRIVYLVDPAGARQILATIAGSMITVTSLVFSMTLVALTLASQQHGPRLLRTFMQDRLNQIVLGSFVATFVYALMILRAVRENDAQAYVPVVSVAFGVVLAVASLMLLIVFIHHIATEMQADTVIASVGLQLDKVLDREFCADPPPNRTSPPQAILSGHERMRAGMITTKSGLYVQAIDIPEIVSLADKADCLVELIVRPGQFVLPGAPLAFIWPAQAAEDNRENLRSFIVLGSRPNQAQDVNFAVRAMVQIALRAMTSSYKDVSTAKSCIDRLGASLTLAAGRYPNPEAITGESGTVRLVHRPVTFGELIDAAFLEITTESGAFPTILLHLADMLDALAMFARTPDHVESLQRYRAILARKVAQGGFDEDLATRIEDSLRRFDQNLAIAQTAPGRPRTHGPDDLAGRIGGRSPGSVGRWS